MLNPEKNAILAVPARMESKRLERKLLCLIQGKSILRHTLEAIEGFSGGGVLLIADHATLIQEAQGLGIGTQLSQGLFVNGTERVAAAISPNFSGIIVNVQADEWTIRLDHIEPLLASFRHDPMLKIASLCSQVPSDDERYDEVKVCLNKEGFAERFFRGANQRQKEAFKHIGVYAYRAEVLRTISQLPTCRAEEEWSLEQLRWMHHGYALKMIKVDYQGFSINSLSDLIKANSFVDYDA